MRTWTALGVVGVLLIATLTVLLRMESTTGEQLGFIHAVVEDEAVMLFDDALWLTGTEAENAAIAAGHCTQETRTDCLPNGYFILNATQRDEQIAVSPSAEVIMQTYNMSETGEVRDYPISLTEFARLINDPDLHFSKLPYTITVEDGEVTRVAEVYIP